MAIYTKTGDKGTTSLFTGERVKKYNTRVETYGTFDECNAQISVAEKYCLREENRELLRWVQNRMFILDGEIASSDPDKFYGKSDRIEEPDVKKMEDVIDKYIAKLPELHEFILPGSSLAGAHLHLARTVCRRAERLLTKISEDITFRPQVLQYANRLSDFLYILARDEDEADRQKKICDEVVRRYQQAVSKH
ncbi:cob(I)yrinic acid a,c-diamide adenosyltransferase [Furfurilactobacillus rossiae]|uniref:Corrinoid adenosyltransferase n=1 Tax=Furfurilactobacillus rossiae DSM 15814 TaxID=1114972 RepID=A0A0R1RGZ3_9LACO|nr:cob(I)yrinic acid a,c-diamide adenosyltransferase [Furfurilactobacillus rossiae]KRL56127.1 adenosylcobalamin-dependent diol dehydratase gamma subunit [Furfurilactobacillus rossiae DSM 15814]QFR66153.1 cob(I)yrinic acid a,c-diamide adenosyltransferase [Furfurilactobacillus rossiae]QLE61584.1 CobIalamin adenosyltransferase PduO [Furfurilactobacillus rossiae]